MKSDENDSNKDSERFVHQVLSAWSEPDRIPEKVLNEDDLLNKMVETVAWMLEKDLQRFWQILYRLDVDEEKVRKILFHPETENVALAIAQLILERERKRLETRKKYSGF